MITLKFYYYVGEINNELGEVLRRILKRVSLEEVLISDVRIIVCSFQSRRRDGTLKRKVERYLEKITVSTCREIVSPVDRSIGAAALRSLLCARIDEFFTKPNASVLKRFYFISLDVSVFVIHLHSTRIFLIVFKSTAWERDEPRDSYIRIFAIYPHDIDDIPSIYTLFRPGSSCIII